MNTKTTLLLAVVLIGLIGGIWLAGGDKPVKKEIPRGPTELLAEQDLVNMSLAQVVKITCQVPDKPEWVFERAPGENTASSADWEITAPFQAKGEAGYIGSIVRKLTGLKYKVSHEPGEPGSVTAERAGLTPPSGVVTLRDDDGENITVELGRLINDRSSYVRLAGEETIYEVLSSTDDVLKGDVLEYRSRQLVQFDRKDLTRLELTIRADGREEVSVLVRHGDGWQFESPGTYDALDAKVDAAVNSLASLRVSGWEESEPKNMGMYGLSDAPSLTVKATVEKEVAAAGAEEEAAAEERTEEKAADPPVTELEEFVVHISSVSPIGDSNKVYIRGGDSSCVGTISKSLAERMTPSMTEWRDSRITTYDVKDASRASLTVGDESLPLKKQGAVWVHAETEAKVDQAAVEELITAVADLKAVSFVEGADRDALSMGFDATGASTIVFGQGEGDPEAKIEIGGFTDPDRKRLVYVRSRGGEMVAKVRVDAVEKLGRSLSAYQDKTIFDFLPNRFQRIGITRNDPVVGGAFSFALGRVGNQLKITEPAVAEVNGERANELATALTKLSATEIASTVDAAEVGLDQPEVTCELTYRPAEITRYIPVEEDAPSSTEDESEGSESGEEDEPRFRTEQEQPPDETYTFLVTRHDGKTYAQRADRPTVYEVGANVLDILLVEYREGDLLRFEASQVTAFRVVDDGGVAHAFTREGSGWKYEPEPDLPMSTPRIQDLLLRINDLTSEKFVAYTGADLAGFGLDKPAGVVEVTLEDGAKQRLIVSSKASAADESNRRYAALPEEGAVFLLSEETISRFGVDLAELEEK